MGSLFHFSQIGSALMRRRIAFVLLLVSAAFVQELYDQLLRHWDYDRKAPLDIKEAVS